MYSDKIPLLLLIVGLSVLLVLCVEAGEVRQEDLIPIDHDSASEKPFDLKHRFKREPEEDEDVKPKKGKGKKSKKDGSTTTGRPDSSTTKGSKKKDYDGDESNDKDKMEKLMKHVTEEKILILKMKTALKAWEGWLLVHMRRTLNPFRVEHMIASFNRIIIKYLWLTTPRPMPRPDPRLPYPLPGRDPRLPNGRIPRRPVSRSPSFRYKREPEDGENPKPKKGKGKKLKKGSDGSTTAAPGGSTTTTGKPDRSDEDSDDPDRAKIEQLMKDYEEEKKLIQKIEETLASWEAWLSRNKKSLNRALGLHLNSYFGQILNVIQVRSRDG